MSDNDIKSFGIERMYDKVGYENNGFVMTEKNVQDQVGLFFYYYINITNNNFCLCLYIVIDVLILKYYERVKCCHCQIFPTNYHLIIPFFCLQ